MQRCEFCGVENALEAPPPAFVPPPSAFVPPPPPAAGGSGAGVFLAVAGLALGGGIIAAVVMGVTTSSNTTTVTTKTTTFTPVPPAIPTEPPPVPLARLHTTPIGWTGAVKVDAPGRVGTATQFDPLANWDWAHTIGNAWWPDAKLYELVADPIQKDGTVDLTGPDVMSIPPHVEYHFVSQDCKAAEKKRAETESNFREASCSLAVEVKRDAVTVTMDLIGVDEDGRAHPIAKPPCSIADAFTYLDANKLTVRPTYQIRLVNDVFGYEYRVSNGLGSATFDGRDVSPTFCAKKPTPKATSTATSTTTAAPVGAEAVPFDRQAAITAVKGAGVDACKTTNGVNGPVRVTVTFQSDGSVRSARVTDQNAETPVGTCAVQKLKAIHVPAYTGESVTVSAAL